MAGVNNYKRTTTGTTTVSPVAGLAGIVINASGTNTITVTDGGTTIATISYTNTLPPAFMYNAALTGSSVVVTMAATGDITILTW